MSQNMQEASEASMPRNLVGSADTVEEAAADEGISEEEWCAANLPPETVTFRWKYANKAIQLYERRLRSLRSYHVGPAVQAWVRSRLEWVHDNKLYEHPEGVIVLTIDPEGDVTIDLEAQHDPDELSESELVWDDGNLAGVQRDATLWVAANGRLSAFPQGGELRSAADTLVHDLAETLDYEFGTDALTHDDLADAEYFAVNDEFGIIACPQAHGPVTDKMKACFDKLWSLE